MSTLIEISTQLSEPFALDDIDFLPKKTIEKDGKTLCMALPYADPRAYEDRLNALCPGEWSTPIPTAIVVGTKLVCFVTVVICGVPHSDVGEAGPGENQGTEAWAQGFKRACSQAGLGRYLYNLEKEWVPFNVQRKMIDLDKAGKQAIVKKMYQKAGIGQAPQGKPILKSVPAQPAEQDADTDKRLAQVKQLFGTVYKADRWDSFKVHTLGLPVSDDGLSLAELDKLYSALMDARKPARAS